MYWLVPVQCRIHGTSSTVHGIATATINADVRRRIFVDSGSMSSTVVANANRMHHDGSYWDWSAI